MQHETAYAILCPHHLPTRRDTIVSVAKVVLLSLALFW